MAIDTKKKLEQDFTQQPQATTQADVDAQDSRTRLWQSLNYSYGDQIRNSDKSYDQAYSQADRQALSRGMQRSSYNNQTLANLSNQKIEAQNDIRAAQIADYQNRINDIEAQERQEAFQREQFEYQKAQDALAQQNWQTQMDYQQSRDAVSDAFNEKQWQAQQDQWQAQQEQWKQEFEYSKMSTDQKLAYESIMTIIGQGNDPSDDLLKRAGLSRADVNAMKAQAVSSGAAGTPKKDTTPDTTTPTDQTTIDALTSAALGLGANTSTGVMYGSNAKSKTNNDVTKTVSDTVAQVMKALTKK